ncbi:MAG: flavodoxin family protein [Candidatus Hodarchaeota archaeon]
MKVLIIYFTMGGRTKRIAEVIAGVLSNHEISYFPVEITGKFSEKLKQLDKFNKGDFSLIETILNRLNVTNYELIIFGMPTHGGFPPKVFDEILTRIENFSGKRVVVFNTARITANKALNYMKAKIEEIGAQLIASTKFKGLFRLGVKKAIKFGTEINESQK